MDYKTRQNHVSLYFQSRLYKAEIIFEIFSLVLVIKKLWELIRQISFINFITISVENSLKSMLVWLIMLVFFNIIMTPMAQSIWGHISFGFQNFTLSLIQVFMIAYSKMDLNSLLAMNVYYSMAFFIIYYMISIFLWHSVFHYLQIKSVETISRLSTLPGDQDLINDGNH